jgi:hypothetical protein
MAIKGSIRFFLMLHAKDKGWIGEERQYESESQ